MREGLSGKVNLWREFEGGASRFTTTRLSPSLPVSPFHLIRVSPSLRLIQGREGEGMGRVQVHVRKYGGVSWSFALPHKSGDVQVHIPLISLFNLRSTSNLVRYMCVSVCVIGNSSSIPRMTFQSSFDRRINCYYFTICYWMWRFRINFWRNSFSKIYKIDESMDINEEEFHIRVVIARARVSTVSSTIHPSLSKFTSVLERCSPSCRKF